MRAWLIVVLVVLVLFVLVGEARQAGEAPAAIKRIHVAAERFSFTPSTIKMKQGSTVELVLHSEDTVHGFRIAPLGIELLIPARGEVRVVIEGKKKGKFPFECSRMCGAGHNMMRGMLVIE